MEKSIDPRDVIFVLGDLQKEHPNNLTSESKRYVGGTESDINLLGRSNETNMNETNAILEEEPVLSNTRPETKTLQVGDCCFIKGVTDPTEGTLYMNSSMTSTNDNQKKKTYVMVIPRGSTEFFDKYRKPKQFQSNLNQTENEITTELLVPISSMTNTTFRSEATEHTAEQESNYNELIEEESNYNELIDEESNYNELIDEESNYNELIEEESNYNEFIEEESNCSDSVIDDHEFDSLQCPLTAEQILYEVLERPQPNQPQNDFNTNICDKRGRCSCYSGKICAYCRVQRICAEIFQSTEPKLCNDIDNNTFNKNLTKEICEPCNTFSYGTDLKYPTAYRKELEVKRTFVKIPKESISCQPIPENKRNPDRHKLCLKPNPERVPRRMGWLWSVNKNVKLGWKPGAVTKPIKKIMRHFLETANKKTSQQIPSVKKTPSCQCLSGNKLLTKNQATQWNEPFKVKTTWPMPSSPYYRDLIPCSGSYRGRPKYRDTIQTIELPKPKVKPVAPSKSRLSRTKNAIKQIVKEKPKAELKKPKVDMMKYLESNGAFDPPVIGSDGLTDAQRRCRELLLQPPPQLRTFQTNFNTNKPPDWDSWQYALFDNQPKCNIYCDPWAHYLLSDYFV